MTIETLSPDHQSVAHQTVMSSFGDRECTQNDPVSHLAKKTLPHLQSKKSRDALSIVLAAATLIFAVPIAVVALSAVIYHFVVHGHTPAELIARRGILRTHNITPEKLAQFRKDIPFNPNAHKDLEPVQKARQAFAEKWCHYYNDERSETLAVEDFPAWLSSIDSHQKAGLIPALKDALKLPGYREGAFAAWAELNNDPELIALAKEIDSIPSQTKPIEITTEDNAHLDGMEILTTDQSVTPSENQKWIIYLGGRGSCYESKYDHLRDLAETTGANLLTANFREMGLSRGKLESKDDLIKDSKAMVRHLLDQGVDANNILMWGFSLGGAIASETAYHMQEDEHIVLNVVNDRSFAMMKSAIRSLIWIPVLRNIAVWIISSWWDIKADHFFERLKGKTYVISDPYDGVVHQNVSMRRALNKTHRAKKICLCGIPMRSSPRKRHQLRLDSKTILKPFIRDFLEDGAVTKI